MKTFTTAESFEKYYNTIPAKLRNAYTEKGREIALEVIKKYKTVKFGWKRGHFTTPINIDIFEPHMVGSEHVGWSQIPHSHHTDTKGNVVFTTDIIESLKDSIGITIKENTEKDLLAKARRMNEKDGWEISCAAYTLAGFWFIYLTKEVFK